MDAEALHQRARTSGVNPFVLRLVRIVLVPFFKLYFRHSARGAKHIPRTGQLILAANHRSFLDPFVIAAITPRPMYFVAKKELFAKRWQGWFLNALGAFPVDRGSSDQEMLRTARAILDRGDAVLIFPEGTRVRPGALAQPKRGVGRLALETGAPVVPVAVHGTDAVRTGWRIRPHRVTIRAGRPLTFPQVENPSKELAQAVTDRIWPCVALQWEWLGGLAPLRRAAVIGAGAYGTSLAAALGRAGLDVDLGTRTREHAEQLRSDPRLDGITVARASDLELEEADVVVLAVPSRALPAVLAQHAERITPQAGLVVVSRGLVPPLGTLPSAFAAERVPCRAVACLGGPATDVVVACPDQAFAAQLVQVLEAAGMDASRSRDVAGVELAGVAQNAAALAAAAAAQRGPDAAGAAAGRVFAEVERHARTAGADPGTFAGLAGTGALVATVAARADGGGESLGQAVEAFDTLPLLLARLESGRQPRRAVGALAERAEAESDPRGALAGRV
jgi:1-acyl-sn-glycerol-3-phosphate acyltransferase